MFKEANEEYSNVISKNENLTKNPKLIYLGALFRLEVRVIETRKDTFILY